ncbi:hypothetical protein F7Q99_00570 [Streptomyces kaniharaensis]|uniref:Uncharacterized protein n=1 Tax=Streptomyces kaniharaensis TaxID=212423 RepID=A0A6N7KJR6_9ACTN|nr:hypothetical protein [Streptomyces kaniharaensis]MQS10809.1 hypothetical protein [Streptomyces kaniharaensis]
MEQAQLSHLEQRVHHLITMTKAIAHDEYEELLDIIHRPGWTTPAEAALVTSHLEMLIRHTEVVAEARRGLMEGARAVKPGQGG